MPAIESKRLFVLMVRLVAFGATLSSVIVMATSHEKAALFGVSFEAKYSQTPAFQYFLIVNAIVSVYGFLVLFLSSESPLWRFAIATDMVGSVLLSSGVSAALAIAYVGKRGNSYTGWLPICGQVPNYCDQVKGALAASFIAIIIYMLLLLQAIHAIVIRKD